MELLKSKILSAKNFWWFGLLLFLLFIHCAYDRNDDEGVILAGAWDLINNRELYKDFFAFVPPGGFYLVFWAWKIFGVHYFVAKLLALIFIFFSAIGINKICYLVAKDKFCFLVPVVFIISTLYWPIVNHNTFNIFFIIWAVYFFIKGLKNYSINNFIISGLLTGLSIICLQHKGVAILLALSSFLLALWLKEKNKLLLKLNLYFIIFSLTPILLLFIKWPIQMLYENLIIFPLFNYTEVNKIPLYLFYFFFIFLLFTIWHLRKKQDKGIWLLIYIQIFLILTSLQRPDSFHIAIILFPIYCLLPLVYKKLRRFNSRSKCINYSIISCFFILIILPAVNYFCHFPPFYSIKNSELLLFINENCQDSQYIYAGPFMPSLYFEARKLNPSPYSFLVINHNTQEQFMETKNRLEKYQPECAILNYKMVKKFNHNENNPVDNYIKDNYQLVFQIKNKLIYKKLGLVNKADKYD